MKRWKATHFSSFQIDSKLGLQLKAFDVPFKDGGSTELFDDELQKSIL